MMLKHIAAVCTAVLLAAAGSWGAAAASPAAPAPTEDRPVTMHAPISPAPEHHARMCSTSECIAMSTSDLAPATISAAATPGTPTVTRDDCPGRTAAGYRVDTPGAAPLIALALNNHVTHADLRAAAPDRAHSATACAG